MPKYSYKCTKCENIITAFHSISKILVDCENCKSNNSLLRMPSNFSYRSTEVEQSYKVGDLVEKAIEDFRFDLEEDKKQINKEDWSPDD